MGLFGRKKEGASAAPRVALQDRVPSTPKSNQLLNYLATSGGGYIALDGKTLRESPMSQEERDIWHAMRTSADAAIRKLKPPKEGWRGVAYLVRDDRDPSAIWVEVEGVRVDRLMRSAVETWSGLLSEPYPVRCAVWTGEKPCVVLYTTKS